MSKIGTAKTLVVDAREATQQCAGTAIRRAARTVTALYDKALAPCGLSLAQFGLLAQIAAAKDDTIAGLAKSLGLEPSTLSRNLRSLERLGLVEIALVESDLRRRAVWLTEAGARRLEAAIPLWRDVEELFRATQDRKLVEALVRMCDRSVDNGAAKSHLMT